MVLQKQRKARLTGFAAALVLAVAVTLVLAPSTSAAPGKAMGKAHVIAPPASREIPRAAVIAAEKKTIEGTIEAVRTDAPFPYIDVKVKGATEQQPQTARVPLGPVWRLEQIGFKPEVGQEVKLTGYAVKVDNLFVALSVEVGGKSFELHPNLAAPGRIAGLGKTALPGMMGKPGMMGQPGATGRMRSMDRPGARGRGMLDGGRAGARGFDRERARQFLAALQTTLNGTVSAVQLGAPAPYIELKDAEGKTAKVYLGPTWLLAQLGVKLEAGSEVKIAAIKHGDFYRALAVEVDGKLIALR